jgi:hypothetical protein
MSGIPGDVDEQPARRSAKGVVRQSLFVERLFL